MKNRLLSEYLHFYTNVMAFSGKELITIRTKIVLESRVMEQVLRFKYLDSLRPQKTEEKPS